MAQRLTIKNPCRNNNFSERRWNEVMLPLAKRLSEYPVIENLTLSYNVPEDYIEIDFSIGNDTYKIQQYKIFTVAKNGNKSFDKKVYFYYGYDEVLRFFTEGIFVIRFA